jgi:hypothetical protein
MRAKAKGDRRMHGDKTRTDTHAQREVRILGVNPFFSEPLHAFELIAPYHKRGDSYQLQLFAEAR